MDNFDNSNNMNKDEENTQASNLNEDKSSSSSNEQTMEIRVLIENHQVGGVIGKGGANVKRVREDAGIFLSILKSEFRNVQERIMVLKGPISCLKTAMYMVVELLVEASASRKDKGGEFSGQQSEGNNTVIRLLVHRAAVGAVIGKAGAVIKDTQSHTGARVQVSNECLPQSTEKTITVTGNATSISQACMRLFQQLAENPIRQGTKNFPYVPGQPSHAYPTPPYGIPHQYPPQVSPYGHPSSLGPYAITQPLAAPTSTQKIAIPTVCAGCVIGKGGSVIRELRNQSQTNISIADPDSSQPNERVVTLTGTPHGIQTAIYLIRQLVEQYQPHQN